jgi:hypothetical protein
MRETKCGWIASPLFLQSDGDGAGERGENERAPRPPASAAASPPLPCRQAPRASARKPPRTNQPPPSGQPPAPAPPPPRGPLPRAAGLLPPPPSPLPPGAPTDPSTESIRCVPRRLRYLPVAVALQMRERKCGWIASPPMVCAHGGDSTNAFPNSVRREGHHDLL